MKIELRADSVVIEGYVNAVERLSKPLRSRMGYFVEKIRAGAFGRAIKRNDDIHILLNHDWSKDLGSTKQGNLELKEDAIGLHARAEISDADVVADAKKGNLVGWSFGFADIDVEERDRDGMTERDVADLDLREVSILNRKKTPAYVGTLLTVRDDEVLYHGEETEEEVEVIEERTEEKKKEAPPEQTMPQQEETPVEIDYSHYEAIIKEMKGVSSK